MDDDAAAASEPTATVTKVTAARPSRPKPPKSSEPPQLDGQTVYVIDANSLIFQVFHAIPEMTSPRGEPVNAVYGFTRDILYLLETRKPDYMFVAFDMKGPTFRHGLYDQYKAQRSEMPDSLRPQFPLIHSLLEAFGIPVLGIESFEADDLLATIARETEELGGECVLVSGDKDCRQLITDQVKIFNVRKNEVYDAASLEADWGIRPEQVVDYQAMVGDPVDNVPGIPLIGPKLAAEMLQKYGSLESILEHADEISGTKRKQNIKEGRERVMLSRQLVRLDTNVPVDLDWQAARSGQLDVDAVLQHFQDFGFHRFGDQIRGLATAAPPERQATDTRLIDTPESLAAFLTELRAQKWFSFDVETTDTCPVACDIVGYSFSWEPGVGYYLPVRVPPGEQHLDPQATLEALRPSLEDEAVGKIGQNLKYDMVALRMAGVEMRGVEFDTLLASYLLDAGERNHNLDELAERYLQHRTIRIDEVIGSGKSQKRMNEVSVPIVAEYAAEDADIPVRLRPLLEPKLEAEGLTSLYRDLELPLIDVLVDLQATGIKVDVERLAALSTEYAGRLATLETEIHALAGHAFNIASPKQLAQVLFEEQKLPVLAKTKTGPSTDASVLEELARSHPLPAKIIEYRQYAKLKGTYVDALPAMVNARTGRVHCSLHQAVAATGRLSSSDPNLQNIPIRTEAGREIRSAFLPGHEGWRLLAADYSQIELRVLAHFSQDETLLAAFAADEDIHTLVASQVYGVPLDAVTREMRRAAKAVNFGIIYGQSAFGLAKSLDIEQAQAGEFINAYFDKYPGVERLLTKILEECRLQGYVKTVLGRRRAIQGIRSGDTGRQRTLPERTAINTVIQGSAADLIKRAMLAVHGRLRREGLAARMLLQIHDELLFEVPEEEVDTLARLVVEEMTTVLPLAVPLKVDVKTGRNWAETEPWN